MLEELQIRNYALIDRLTIQFSEGLSILSGETGAGKSILVGALGLVLGLKVSQDVIRTGTDETEVSAVVNVKGNKEAETWLQQREIPFEDGVVILRRIVRRNGRGGSYLQSVPVSLGDLQEFTSLLIDLHGQHEHQSLFYEENHRKFLDRFAGISERVERFTSEFQGLAQLRKHREELDASEKERIRELDYLKFAVDEINKAALKEEEEEELIQERKLLSEHEKLMRVLEDTLATLSEGRGGILGELRRSANLLQSIEGIDSSLEPYRKRLENTFYEIQDVTQDLKAYAGKRTFDPQRLEYCEERLAEIYRLGKKYGPSLKEILQFREQALKRIQELERTSQEMGELDRAITEKERNLLAEAHEISETRKKAAEKLQDAVTEALSKLGMKKIRFQISLTRKESNPGVVVCGPFGFDSVSFLIAPNPGEPLKPLKEIASGGEVSRIMLAIKTVLAESDSIGCLIFDEIDTGIGGEAAVVVGEYLYNLSRYKQVLVITHLASLAARGDRHVRVEKIVEGERTYTDIKYIEREERVKEIARMLSGEPEGTVSLIHAEELLRKFGRIQG
jgi:DNA repair protein RecN (Recombination protein N)